MPNAFRALAAALSAAAGSAPRVRGFAPRACARRRRSGAPPRRARGAVRAPFWREGACVAWLAGVARRAGLAPVIARGRRSARGRGPLAMDRLALRFRRFGRARVEAQVGGGNGLPDQLLDRAQKIALLVVAKRDGLALRAGARGAADAMDVGFRNLRQLEIDDMADAVDIDAARRDVGGDEHGDLAGLEFLQGAQALVLALVAVDRLGVQTRVVETLGDAVGPALGAREHDGAAEVGIAQQVDQRVALALGLDQDHALRHAVGGFRHGRDRHLDRHVQHFLRQRSDLRRHGRRKEQGLPSLGQFGENLANGDEEAEVEHVVGLVEHHGLRPFQAQVALSHVVEQAARRGDEHVETARQRLQLRRQNRRRQRSWRRAGRRSGRRS